MVYVSVSYDVNVEPAKVVLTRVSFEMKKKASRENKMFSVLFFLAIWFFGVCFSSLVELFVFFSSCVCDEDERTQRILTVE
jgi:hypothetical protein